MFFYRFLNGVNKAINGSLYEDFAIESVDEKNGNNLITKDSGYLTVIDFRGALNVMNSQSMDSFIDDFLLRLQGDLKAEGRTLDFCIMHDPGTAEKVVSPNVDIMKRSSRKIKLNADSFLNEKEDILCNLSNYYSCYLSIMSSPDALGASKGDVISRDQKLKKERGIIPRFGEHTQCPDIAIAELGDSHNAFVKNICAALDQKINYSVLKADEALLKIKKTMFLEYTSDKWKPSFPGDKLKINFKRSTPVKTDLSDTLTVPLAAQFYDICPTRDDGNSSLVDIDGMKYAPVLAEYGPETPIMFSKFSHVAKGQFPYRINFTIHTGHDKTVKQMRSRSALGSYITVLNSNNSVVKKGLDELIQLSENNPMATMSVTACTWGKDSESCVRNKRMLIQSLVNWSGLSIIEERGDPIGLLAESVGGITLKKRRQAPEFPMPLFEAINMCPLSQPASSWQKGSLLFLTPYDSLYPMDMGSPLQTSWLNLVFAPPGYGKSFLLSAINLSSLIKSGTHALPYLSILDIGYSSAVFVRLIKSMLPDSQKHLAQAYKLQNSKEYAINIFDTMLCCRYPTSLERSQIEDLVTELLTPGDGKAFEGMEEIVKLMVEKVYAMKSDYGEPNEYTDGVSSVVSQALRDNNISVYDGMSWWSVVDALFEVGDYRTAKLAQRYAVPRLSDLSSVINDNAFDDYREYQVNGSPAMTRIKNSIKNAVTSYPIMSTITQFDISDSKIISLDLQDVVPRSDGENSKTANVMYMLGKMCTTKAFYMGMEAIKEIPEKYREYHRKVFTEMDSVQKYLCVDEYHRTKSSTKFRSGLIRDGREGRKFGIIISVLSQYPQDFDEELIRAATNKFILYVGDDDTERKIIQDRFSISESAMESAKLYCHGPGKDGSNLLYLGRIRGVGTVQQILRYVGGVKERWAYTTNKKDDRLIGKLIDKIGLENAYEVLSKKFPSGTAEPYIDSISKSEETVGIDTDVTSYVADKIIKEWYEA